MSAYFQRLIQLSGLAPPPPAPAVVRPITSTPAAAADVPAVLEIQAESVTGESTAEPAARSSRSLSSASQPPLLSPQHEATVVVPAPLASPRPTFQPQPPDVDLTQGDGSSTSSDPASEIPPQVLEAVMKWIASGEAQAGDSKFLLPPETSRSLPSDTRTAESRTQSSVTPAKIPDRVIEIAQELANEPRRNQPAAESPVNVSIGSINVRIEAPTPPAPPSVTSKRAPASARGATSPATRAAGFSKLRRHYIIPH